MKKLVLSDVFIKSDNDKSSATFTVENHGATMSGRIDVRCTFFDAQDNTVGESWDSIGPIKPGRQGFGRTTSIYYEGATARTSDCHIEEPRNP